MKSNEVKNFVKQYKNTVCLDENLKTIKLIECVEENSTLSCVIMLEGGQKIAVPSSSKIIPLKGRLKERDYNYIEAKFHKSMN